MQVWQRGGMDPTSAEQTPRAAAVDGARDGLPLLVGIAPFGLVAGATAVEAGLGVDGAVALSLGIFAGASQLAAIELLSDGAPIAVAVLTVLIINLRMVMYSASLAPHLAHEPRWRRGLAAYLMTDQAYALTLDRSVRRPEAPARMAYYLGVAVLLWATWQAMTVVGAVIGAALPEWLPLEAAVPLVFLALLVPAVTDRPTLLAATVSGVVATAGRGLPANAGLLVGALLGIAVGTALALGRDQGS